MPHSAVKSHIFIKGEEFSLNGLSKILAALDSARIGQGQGWDLVGSQTWKTWKTWDLEDVSEEPDWSLVKENWVFISYLGSWTRITGPECSFCIFLNDLLCLSVPVIYIGDGNHTHFIRILWEVIKYTRHSELAPGKCSINVSCWCWCCFLLPLWLTSLVVEQTFRKQRKWSVVKGLVWVSAGPFTKVIQGNLPDLYWVFCFLIFHWDQCPLSERFLHESMEMTRVKL